MPQEIGLLKICENPVAETTGRHRYYLTLIKFQINLIDLRLLSCLDFQYTSR